MWQYKLNDRGPRSIYGKILSSVDRNVDVNDSLKRIYWKIKRNYN